MSFEVYTIIEEYELPLSWAKALVTIEARGRFVSDGYETPYGAVSERDRVQLFRLDEDDIETWSADMAKLSWGRMPVDLKAEIIKRLKEQECE